jgi:hypothetical protein
MARRPKYAKTIFFPWETRGGLRRFLVPSRIGQVLAGAFALAFVLFLVDRERHLAGERRTLVALSAAKHAVVRYIADHEGKCPPSLEAAYSEAGQQRAARDGWGRPLRLVCSPTVSDREFLLMSDGPDGKPGGLDRIEY